MSFIPASSVAGPSRIPYRARNAVHVVQRSYAVRAPVQRRGRDEEGEGGERGERGDRGDRKKAQVNNFNDWMLQVAYRFKRPSGNGPARWLGNGVPYESNPTFRPPPPLSNDLMNVLNEELAAGKRTVGQISQAYNISKHRLEAIRKLKAVEAEMVRQDVPLQRAFQQNMEMLLGVESPLTSKGKPSATRKQDEETSRLTHPSTAAELQEEHTFGEDPKSGAFAPANLSDEGFLHQDVWEMQGEADYLRETKKAAEELAARKAAELADVASGHDDDSSVTAAAAEAAATRAHKMNTAGKSVFRFVDTSNQAQPEPASKGKGKKRSKK